MPIDFPNTPTVGQTFTVGAITWQWDGATWKALGSSNPGRDYVSATAPTSPAEGARWLNSNDLKTYTFYDSQWIESSPNLKGETGLQGQPAGNNVIINGAFDFWQRGTSSAVGGYLADRWRYDNVGGTYTQSQQAFTLGAAPATGYEGSYFYRLNLTVTSGYQALAQRIEDVRTLAGQTVTLSFWAKTGSANSIGIYLDQDFGSGGSSQVTTTLNSAQALTTGWVRYTFTVSLPSLTGKTIGTGSNLAVRFSVGTATTYDLWGVQLEAGSVATPFRRNGSSLQAELAACQRYYTRWSGADGSLSQIGIGFANATTTGRIHIALPVQMRTAPSAVDYSALFLVDINSGTAITSCSLTGSGYDNPKAVALSVSVASGLTAFRPYFLNINANAAGYIGFNAEL